MQGIRKEVAELAALGPFPAEEGADPNIVQKHERAYKAIARPVTDDEARLLVTLFGEDGYFGLASSLMHLIETAPGWPLEDCLRHADNEWLVMLRTRARKAGK